ncbi:Zinc transporter 7 [Striga hermonthica]|uniref:Zinc transporter 7 n=1 Tax=Striga hermonthica TaxID=68872 RepID=A0A9N7RB56_STRHE|nr:Zinc transporter 7 [Striga hermonthica]
MARINPAPILAAVLLLLLAAASAAEADPQNASTTAECGTSSSGCRNSDRALKFKLIAIASILAASMAGVCLPIVSRSVPALHPDRDMFVLVKAFASGVILATGYMHVLPDSFADLTSPCLPENPWRRFPFATFAAMLSAVATLMVDSVAMSYFYSDRRTGPNVKAAAPKAGGGHSHGISVGGEEGAAQLLRYRVVAQVLELGIVVHSVVIGLSMGASDNPCTIKPLVAAICFHQLFEGMGLGGCIMQAEYGMKMKATLVFFFSTTTPFGIALGIGLSKVYSESSPTALIVVGLLNACSAGLLNYMALVDLLAAEFMGSRLQKSMRLQGWAFVAVLLGMGGMSLMAKWA